MPTQAELQIVIEAQDRASAQLRSLGQEVGKLQQVVTGAGGSRGLAAMGAGGVAAAAGVAALTGALVAAGAALVAVGSQISAGLGANSRLEQATASFEALTGSAQTAGEMIRIVRDEANRGFDVGQMQQAGRVLVTAAQGSVERFRELVQLAEQLTATDPGQGIASAAFAIREALGGDFQSLAERFEANRASIQRWREEGVSNLEIVRRVIEGLGGSAAAVDRLGRTLDARRAVVGNFLSDLQQLATSGVYARISDAFGRAVDLIERHGDRLRDIAAGVGVVLGRLADQVTAALAGPLRALTQLIAPGLWDQIAGEMAQVPEQVERIAPAAQRAAPAVRDLSRELATIGLAAAQVQLEADRVRRRYEDQLEPLQAQLRLLQQSGELQRVQNALAGNRAAVETLRLNAEIARLESAAGGAEDPAAEGLTLRQRLIALALQERRLRRDELSLTEQQRPAVQSLEAQIAAIQEQQRQTLKPLEDQLATYREQVAVLQIQRQQAQLLAEDAEKAAAQVRQAGRGAADPQALADSKTRGESIADAWLTGYQQWVEANGGNVGAAVATSILAGIQKKLADTFFPAGAPQVSVAPGSPVATAIDIGNIVVQVGTAMQGGIPAIGAAVGAEVARRVIEALTQTAAATDPGASPQLQGAGR